MRKSTNFKNFVRKPFFSQPIYSVGKRRGRGLRLAGQRGRGIALAGQHGGGLADGGVRRFLNRKIINPLKRNYINPAMRSAVRPAARWINKHASSIGDGLMTAVQTAGNLAPFAALL